MSSLNVLKSGPTWSDR